MAQEVDLSALQALERAAILQVLFRDQALQSREETRVRKLKAQLQHLRWRGARCPDAERREQACARCQRALGRLLNRGAPCQGCSHRVCRDCRVFLGCSQAWKCTVCFEDRNVKIKTGEWFFEERAKKFPTEGKHETAGARLLQSYQRLSSISVVPPTPPPHSESQCDSPSRVQELGQFKGFNKSMENLFLSVTTHMKKLSKSQNDMTSDKLLGAAGRGQNAGQTERRSQSDTAIDAAARKGSAPELWKPPDRESPRRPSSPALQLDHPPSSPVLPDTLFSGGSRHGSLISINSTCTEMGDFDNASVTGEIELALHYSSETQSLEISIKACKDLAYGEEKKKKCNPYVKTHLLPDRSSQGKRKTRVQMNTVNPIFQESLQYRVQRAQLATRQLQVSVWHQGTLGRRVFLGEVILPLATWDFGDSATRSFRGYALRPKAEHCENSPDPELTIRAKLVLPAALGKASEALGEPDSPTHCGQLCLVVLAARNLPVRSDGTLNAFVKGCLTLPDQQKLRLKSPVLKKQACPQWKHSFVFNNLTTSQLSQSSLELTVWDQATFGLNDRLLGGAKLGSKAELKGSVDVAAQSKLQWQKVLASPNLWTDMTLILH
ncbi:synaptotagmin-like protein 3 isoform X2 [Suncus etruscus]|uniref:synaptotagmin-like protein 3 isoform X2 n=1 Tax=Suncus etruscus TaxID=109475 RepID=UPI002110836F|nr:synaptotagmin-like protein 3 isoform X2 [Suncus etruscus]